MGARRGCPRRDRCAPCPVGPPVGRGVHGRHRTRRDRRVRPARAGDLRHAGTARTRPDARHRAHPGRRSRSRNRNRNRSRNRRQLPLQLWTSTHPHGLGSGTAALASPRRTRDGELLALPLALAVHRPAAPLHIAPRRHRGRPRTADVDRELRNGGDRLPAPRPPRHAAGTPSAAAGRRAGRADRAHPRHRLGNRRAAPPAPTGSRCRARRRGRHRPRRRRLVRGAASPRRRHRSRAGRAIVAGRPDSECRGDQRP